MSETSEIIEMDLGEGAIETTTASMNVGGITVITGTPETLETIGEGVKEVEIETKGEGMISMMITTEKGRDTDEVTLALD
jgi:hypothetical protein